MVLLREILGFRRDRASNFGRLPAVRIARVIQGFRGRSGVEERLGEYNFVSLEF